MRDLPRPSRTALVALAGTLLLAACGGGGDEMSRSEEAEEAAAVAELPVSPPEGPVDQALAEQGEKHFKTRGCVACHTVGEGRKVGPDLEGVTQRRSFPWLYHMVMNPDSMVKNDSIARGLLEEYFTPMSDQNVKPEQFRAIYEYLRSESPEGRAGAAASDGDTAGPSASAVGHRARRGQQGAARRAAGHQHAGRPHAGPHHSTHQHGRS